MNPQVPEVIVLKIRKKGLNYLVTYREDEEKETTFSEEQILDYRIIPNQTFSKAEWQKCLAASKNYFYFDKVLHYINYQERTISEAEQYLVKLKLEKEQIGDIIAKLINLHYLDDERYAKMYTEQAINNYKGPKQIRFALEQKHIEPNIINSALQDYSTAYEQKQIAEIIAQNITKNQDLPIAKQQEKLFQKLLRLGYNSSLINQALKIASFHSTNSKFAMDFTKATQKNTDKSKIIAQLMRKGYDYNLIKQALSERNIK